MTFRSVLIANRGEIALRIQRSARAMGLRVIAVYSEADRHARHAREADAAHCIGGAAPAASYLNIAAIIAAARASGAEAVHPGYGFLAENADFAQAVLDAGLVWVGPPPAAMRAMGDKAAAKRLAHGAGVPVLPGFDAGGAIEYPVMIKAVAGGGGRGMRLVRHAGDLEAQLASARSEARTAFGDERVILERALEAPRHVEVQLLADAHGAIVHLGERDCSVQRRHQKLIEETPSPAVDAALRTRLGDAAIAAARAAGYVNAGTVEFLLEADGRFWFMEMNTRLQVEHPVTEMVCGIDLVEWQLRVAAGEALAFRQDDLRFGGHAIEARLCAEDPAAGFLPQAGRILRWREPAGVRVEHALESGAEVSPFYDSMIAKLVAHAPTREEARLRLAAALDATVVLGIRTNAAFLAAVLRDDAFARGEASTATLAQRFADWRPAAPSQDDLLDAAALIAHAAARDARFGEWSHWSNTPERLVRLSLGHEGERHDIALACEDIEARAERLDRIESARDGSVLYVGAWTFHDLSMAPPDRAAGAAADGRLAAPMNGRVVGVAARAGETIAAGSALVVLEAMKMEHQLTLPVAVKVTAVHAVHGAQVSPGALLVEYEAAPLQ